MYGARVNQRMASEALRSERHGGAMGWTTYTSAEVARETGTRIRTLQRWVERGFVSPDRDPKKNRDLRWNPKHLREARVLAGLRSMGVSNQQLHKAIARLVAAGHNPTSTGRFLVQLRRDRLGNPRGGVASLVKVCDEGDALDLMRGGRVACLWDLDPPGDELVAEI